MALNELMSRVAVIVPVLNAAEDWCLFNPALRSQGLRPDQVLIVDSSSTDGTAELARIEGYRVLSIERRNFNHGGTRQEASRLFPAAEFLVYLTQDAVLATEDAVAKLIEPFEDSMIGASFGRQLPRAGAGSIEAHARLFNYPSRSDVRTLATRETKGFKAVFFSNSFAAYRASALEAVGGFPTNVIVSEETIVSSKLLLAGWKTAYVAEAQTYHSHGYSLLQEFSRYFDIGVLHSQEPWLLAEFGGVGNEGRRFATSECKYLWTENPAALPSSVLRLMLKYLGYKLGRRQLALGPSLSERFSQQKQFWNNHRDQ